MSNLRPDLVVRILCDQIPPGALDAIYLFGQTSDNEHSIFQAAERIWREGLAQRILFAASEPRSGYPGFGPWFNALRQIGIPEEMLLGVPTTEFPVLHTLSEAQALLRFAKAREFVRIGITAAPFHQVRAFVTAVSVAAAEYRNCRLYSLPGSPLPWHETVVHSQGVEQGTRFQFAGSELEKIDRYREKGDLISDEMILAYLENRSMHD